MSTGRSPRLSRCGWRGPLLGLLLTSFVAQAAPGEQAEEHRRFPSYEAERWFALAHQTSAEFEQRVAQVGCDKVPWSGNVMISDPFGFRGVLVHAHELAAQRM